MKQTNKLNNVLKIAVKILFVIYMTILFKIILFKGIRISQLFTNYAKLRSINLVPFAMIKEYYYLSSGMLLRSISNTFGNAAVFLPLGYFLPALFNKFKKLRYSLIFITGLSLFFEISQYILGLGISDIDDVILNTTGGVIGFLTYKLIKRKMHEKENRILSSIIAITFVCFICGFIVAKQEFGIYLGIEKYHEVDNRGKDIPKRTADANGFYVGGDSKSMTLYTEPSSKKKNGIFVFKEQQNSKKIKFYINDSTKLYLTKYSEKGNTGYINYKKLSLKKYIYRIPEDTMVNIWTKKEENKKIAVVITLNLFGSFDKPNRNKIKPNLAGSIKEVRNKYGIPKRQEDLSGEVISETRNKINVNQIINKRMNKGWMSLRTHIKRSFTVNKATKVIIGIIYSNKYHYKNGAVNDIIIKETLDIWGYKKNGQLIADTVRINIVK